MDGETVEARRAKRRAQAIELERLAILGELYELGETRREIGERVARSIARGDEQIRKLLPRYEALAQRAEALSQAGGGKIDICVPEDKDEQL